MANFNYCLWIIILVVVKSYVFIVRIKYELSQFISISRNAYKPSDHNENTP